jgi:hypothetical protein
MILLNALTSAAAVAALAAAEFGVDEFLVNKQPGWEASDDGDAAWAVRFAGGLQSEYAHAGNATGWCGDSSREGGSCCSPSLGPEKQVDPKHEKGFRVDV